MLRIVFSEGPRAPIAVGALKGFRIEGTVLRAAPVYGPHSHLSAVDGTLYLDHEVFASYQDGTGVWCCDPAGQGWPIIVVKQS